MTPDEHDSIEGAAQRHRIGRPAPFDAAILCDRVDHCKRCRRPTLHAFADDPHGRSWWRCACGAGKTTLTRRAVPADHAAEARE